MSAAIERLSEKAETLLPVLDSLSEKDREGLTRYLLASFEGPGDDPTEVREAWKTELKRRVGELRSGKVKGVPIEEVFKRSREKHP